LHQLSPLFGSQTQQPLTQITDLISAAHFLSASRGRCLRITTLLEPTLDLPFAALGLHLLAEYFKVVLHNPALRLGEQLPYLALALVRLRRLVTQLDELLAHLRRHLLRRWPITAKVVRFATTLRREAALGVGSITALGSFASLGVRPIRALGPFAGFAEPGRLFLTPLTRLIDIPPLWTPGLIRPRSIAPLAQALPVRLPVFLRLPLVLAEDHADALDLLRHEADIGRRLLRAEHLEGFNEWPLDDHRPVLAIHPPAGREPLVDPRRLLRINAWPLEQRGLGALV
jgi:hypothetical protein